MYAVPLPPIGGVLIRNGREKKAENVVVSPKIPVIPKEAFTEFSYVSRQTIFLKLIILIRFLFIPSRLQKKIIFFLFNSAVGFWKYNIVVLKIICS